MENEIQWYDSVWLSRYLAAKEYIANYNPEKLQEFIARFNVLRTDPNYKIKELPGLLSQDVLDFVKKIIQHIPQANLELYEVDRFDRNILHDHPIFLKMQADLTDRVSEWVGEPVEPCYNFLSLYSKMGI